MAYNDKTHDRTRAKAASGSLNNTTSPISVNISADWSAKTVPFQVVIWADSTLDATSDSSAETAIVTAVGAYGGGVTSATMTRASAVAHTGTPYVASTLTAAQIDALITAIDGKQALTGGPLSLATRAITGNRTLDATDYTILADATGGNITVTLPAAASHSGRVYNVKKTDSNANTVTLDGNASETIDGATTYALSAQYEALTIQSDGSNWHIL